MKYILKWPNGPAYDYTLKEIRKEFAAGKIREDCTVRASDSQTWQTVRALLESTGDLTPLTEAELAQRESAKPDLRPLPSQSPPTAVTPRPRWPLVLLAFAVSFVFMGIGLPCAMSKSDTIQTVGVILLIAGFLSVFTACALIQQAFKDLFK